MPTEPAPAKDQKSKDDALSPLSEHASVWLHGAGMSGTTWHKMTSGLPLAVTPDLPGHGNAPLVTPPTVTRFSEAMLPYIPDNCILIGHSLGGMVALELAVRARKRVAALVLIEAVPTVRDTRSGRISAAIAGPIVKHIPPSWMGWLAGLGQSPQASAEVRAQLSRHSNASLFAAMRAAGTYDGRDRLGRIAVPTLVIVGEQNSATHAGARLSARMIRDAEFVQLAGGHILHMDNPTELRKTIDSFLRRKL